MIKFNHDTFSNPQTTEILAELSALTATDGVKLTAILDKELNGLDIIRKENTINVRYSSPVYFYRALGLICEQEEPEFHISETARFNTNGVMVDCSRNAVPSVPTVKKLIRQMALMGMNTLMLYTEDTYEVPDEPYFGYMRGRYTQEELRELDAYAAGFGVEMVPCIQTLAHLSAALKWYPDVIKDTGDILLVDEPETYVLTEKMIAAYRTAFRTRRIHLGMDEAHMLGRGRYYDKHGDSDRFELMCRHLEKVLEICQKYDFEPMIWSDMFFRFANNGNYYGRNPVSDKASSKIPKGITLVYWDYYNNEETYDRMIKAHLALPARTVFAGGAWKWQGFLPSLKVSIKRTKAALKVCAKNGIKDVFTTAWGDDGSECGLFSLLPAFQAQAELGFYEDISEQWLEKRLKTCTGARLSDFAMLDMPDLPAEHDKGWFAPHKYLLYQDVLLGLFDRHIPKGIAARYAEFYEQTRSLIDNNNPYNYLFETAAALYSVLALKSELGVQLKKAYDNNDREFLKKAANEIIPELIVRVEAFYNCLEAQWMKENKPFGFEVLDIRLGALIQRLKTAKRWIEQYLNGKFERILALEETRLDFPLVNRIADGSVVSINQWTRIVTPSVI
jgi:hexosaminidase